MSNTNPSHIPNGTTDAAKAKLQPVPKLIRAEAYRDYLASLGYTAEVDEVGLVTFTADGRKYWLMPNETWDNSLLIAAAYNIATVTKHADRARTAIIAGNVTNDMPYVYVWLDQNGKVHAVAELHLSDPFNLHDGFAERFSELKTAVERFTTQLSETTA